MSATPKKAKKPAVARSHPPYGDTVVRAVREMKERGGSSRQAIIKYIRDNFKMAVSENVNSYVRRSLVAAAEAGRLVYTKGTGVSGSFRVAEKKVAVKKPKAKKSKAK